MICVECRESETLGSNKLCGICRVKPTKRELIIIKGLIAGKQNKMIAYDIKATENVVKTQLNKIFKKFNTINRTTLAVLVVSEHPEWLVEG